MEINSIAAIAKINMSFFCGYRRNVDSITSSSRIRRRSLVDTPMIQSVQEVDSLTKMKSTRHQEEPRSTDSTKNQRRRNENNIARAAQIDTFRCGKPAALLSYSPTPQIHPSNFHSATMSQANRRRNDSFVNFIPSLS